MNAEYTCVYESHWPLERGRNEYQVPQAPTTTSTLLTLLCSVPRTSPSLTSAWSLFLSHARHLFPGSSISSSLPFPIIEPAAHLPNRSFVCAAPGRLRLVSHTPCIVGTFFELFVTWPAPRGCPGSHLAPAPSIAYRDSGLKTSSVQLATSLLLPSRVLAPIQL